MEFPVSRVVYRGNNNANANGGVSNANANNDASNAHTNVGSRLANNQFFLIGLRHRERVPNAEPRGTSHSNSGIKAGKLKNKWMGRVW